jgi:dGTPase
MNAFDVWQERRTGWKLAPTDARTEYDVDFARVVHSGSFRRLQGKTQILNLGDSDFYRTRLTHSLEVAQIASGIVRQLEKTAAVHPAHPVLPPISLIQAISLTHDLGHPPFGHGGEVALNYCMRDYGGFEGNGQTLRIASRLEHFSDRYGYDFTRRAILGVLKYPAAYSEVASPDIQPRMSNRTTGIDIIDRSASKPPKCYFDSERDVVEWALSKIPAGDREKFKTVNKVDGKHGKTAYKSIDSCIMEVADDIAYGIHDLEDSIALGLIDERDFRNKLEREVCDPFLNFLSSRCGNADPYEYMVSYLFGNSNERKQCISRLVGTMIHAVRFTTDEDFDEPVLRYGVRIMDGYRALLNQFQDLVVEVVIHSANVQHLTRIMHTPLL